MIGEKSLESIATLCRAGVLKNYFHCVCKVSELIKQWDDVKSPILFSSLANSSLCGHGAVLCMYLQRFVSLAGVVQA